MPAPSTSAARLPGWVRGVIRAGQSTPVRVGVGVGAVALAAYAMVSRRDEVLDAVASLRPGSLLLALLATLANAAFTGLLWRTVLADLGSGLPVPVATRVFFVGQIGKYLPGSLWPIVMQAELARDHGVPRRRTVAATLVTMLLSLTSGLLVALIALPFVPHIVDGGLGWALLLVIPLMVLLHPALLGPVLDRLIMLAGGEPLEQRPSLAGIAVATGWAVAAWVAAGLQVWLLVRAVSPSAADLHALVLCVGGYAFAWGLGMLVVIAPAGAGVREVALLTALGSVVTGGAALVVVLVSRVLFTLVDLVTAAAGYLWGRHDQGRRFRP